MKKLYYLFILLIFSFQTHSQSFEWAVSFTGSGNNHSSSITVDQRGNIYTTGFYYTTVDFDPDTSVFNLTSAGSSDIFITKLDSNGGLIWAKSFSGPGIFSRGLDIINDENGNVYISGRFNGKVDFDPSPAAADTFFLSASGSSRGAFITKLDSNGNFIWAKHFTGNGSADANAIAIDQQENVYVTGSFVGTIDFDPGASTFNLSSNGASDIFISKLDSNGNFEWAGAIAGTSIDDGKAISIDQSGNVCVVAESLSQVVDVDPGRATVNLSMNGSFDVLVIKLDTAGNYLWATNFGGTGLDRPSSMVLDKDDNIYIAGQFQGTADFNPGTATFNMTAAGLEDAFLVKLDGLGNFVWAKSIGGTSRDRGNAIALDSIGNIYLSGEFNGRADFDPSSSAFNLTPNGNFDGYTAKYRSSGDFVWATAIGGPGMDVATSVAVNQFGSVYTTGRFIDSVDFNPGTGTFMLRTPSGFGEDIYIQKLGQCWLPPIYIVDTLCSDDTLIVGSSIYTTAGNYIDIVVTNNGCDSSIFSSIEKTVIDTSYSNFHINPFILEANQFGASYQWLDCNNGFAPISGEINQSFYIPATGSYAVEITMNGCVDTSTCKNRILVGLNQELPLNNLSIYPNPSSTSYTIQLPSAGKLEVFDSKGKLLSSDLLPKGNTVKSTEDLAPGIYFLCFSNEKASTTKRFVVLN